MGEQDLPSPPPSGSAGTVLAAEAVLDHTGALPWYRRFLPFLGPAFVAAVAYIDPGNFATNIQGGALFGYTLLWVIGASNLMAMLIQVLSAKLGIATGQNLAEVCRDRFPAPLVWIMWGIMELVAMATDLAEFLGAALGFYLLFHIPLLWAGLLTAVITFVVLGLERFGFRPLEAVISALLGVVALCYLVEILLCELQWKEIARHALVPGFEGKESVFLAAGILGATVMPHVIFLHSALTQGRVVVRDPGKLRRLFRFQLMDVVMAMGVAGLVNGAMLIMAASSFHQQGLHRVGTIEEAYRTLTPLLGPMAAGVFAVSLLASGISSSTVGTLSGQVIMQGFMRFHIPVWIRRGVTLLPSLAVIAGGLDPTRTLVISQVILSFGLPFAVIPLVLFTSNPRIMGVLVNAKVTTLAASVVAGLIVSLNLYLLWTLVS
ncbi:MAG TPA: Nramp family divalent metal transporter [Syntrophobacteraceae bacterium]|nr:Nramp family divalent metal transporter [Syntrophobacteraceae bacterium]